MNFVVNGPHGRPLAAQFVPIPFVINLSARFEPVTLQLQVGED